GAFSVPDLKTSYTGLDTRIDLTPEKVTIRDFKILDDDRNWLTIGGSLAVHEGQVGAVDIQVKSDDFRVINNKIGNLKLDSDFRVTGTVRAPKIEGTIEIEPGTVDVGEILTVASRAPYSTTQAPIGPAGAGIPEPTLPLLPA